MAAESFAGSGRVSSANPVAEKTTIRKMNHRIKSAPRGYCQRHYSIVTRVRSDGIVSGGLTPSARCRPGDFPDWVGIDEADRDVVHGCLAKSGEGDGQGQLAVLRNRPV